MSLLALMSRDDLEGITSGAEIDPKKPGCGSVGQVQLALKQQGYYDGPMTGAFNDELAAAMQEFLADQGMSASSSNEEFCQALRTAQMELSSKARSEVNSRILGVNPILLLLGAAAVAVGVVKFRGGMRANHGMTYCKRCLNPKVLGEPCEYCRRHPWFEQNGRVRGRGGRPLDAAFFSPQVYDKKKRPRYRHAAYKSRAAASADLKKAKSAFQRAGLKVHGKPTFYSGERYGLKPGEVFWDLSVLTPKRSDMDKAIRVSRKLKSRHYNRMKVAS